MAILDRLLAACIGFVPRGVVGKVAAKYVAGETIEDAVAAARRLREAGCCTTFDLLGEFITEESQADATADEYIELLDRIEQDGFDGNISVKLTAFGLQLDEEHAYERLKRVVAHARSLGNFVRIDMEDSSCTDATFRLYRRLRADGFDNAGLVLQAYMRRTLDDISALTELTPSYRICKGIYVEAEEVAFQEAEEIRDGFRAALAAMLDNGSYVGIATHDEILIAAGREAVASRSLDHDRYEFQMLLGVTDHLRKQVVADGHRVRVYVPYGRDWYAYCVRRLKENPRIGRYVFLAMFRRGS